MNQLNQIVVRGRLVSDPRQVKLDNGGEITSFTIANNQEYYNAKEKKAVETTHFFDCKGFGPSAKVANQYLKKGREVLISGILKQEKWQDKESGETRSKIVVEISNFEFLGGNGNKTESNNEEQQEKPKNERKQRNPFA